jgi:hypothetical protein
MKLRIAQKVMQLEAGAIISAVIAMLVALVVGIGVFDGKGWGAVTMLSFFGFGFMLMVVYAWAADALEQNEGATK